MKKSFTTFLVCLLLIIFLSPVITTSKTGLSDKKSESTLRAPIGFLDNQKNAVSNVEFYTSNYGIFGLNYTYNKGGLFWPRNSGNQYLYAAGFWFGAQKFLPGETFPRKLVEVSYNPNNGKSWFIPGRIEDGDLSNQTDSNTYRAYFSSDFRKYSGVPFDVTDGPNWPLWINPDDLLSTGLYLGGYEPDISKRNKDNYPFGPAFVSGEDIFSTYKDTDLEQFDGGPGLREPLGYPLRLQVEQTIYTWGNDLLKDVVIIYYNIINFSQDTLYDCWFAPVYDVDIGKIPSPEAENDYTKLYNDDRTLNLVIAWSDTMTYEGDKEPDGIIGFSYLMTPSVDSNNFLRKDKKIFLVTEQLGIKTYKNWPIDEDYCGDIDRYAVLSSCTIDTIEGNGDMRLFFSTGPFNMLPGDSSKIALSIMFTTQDSIIGFQKFTTSKPDFTKIVELARYTQNFFYNNMVLGIDDEKKYDDDNLNIYPNPAVDLFNILSENSDIIEQIEIFNVLGEKIFVQNDILTSEYKLNTRNLQNGSYYIRIKSGNNTETKLLQIAK